LSYYVGRQNRPNNDLAKNNVRQNRLFLITKATRMPFDNAQLKFTFPFYGKNYRRLHISPNGAIHFAAGGKSYLLQNIAQSKLQRLSIHALCAYNKSSDWSST
jgi:hypothetical protein